jgi:hypothetical protein
MGQLARRSFVKYLALGGSTLLPAGLALADHKNSKPLMGRISDGDAAILRFLAAAEILETDLWQQYTEFADTDGPYSDALETIDDNMTTYIDQNTIDEFSHRISRYVPGQDAPAPVNLEPFRTLPAARAGPTPQLTNLMHERGHELVSALRSSGIRLRDLRR